MLNFPEISDVTDKEPNLCLKSKSPSSTSPSTLIKANVFLNHPEITFPIPVEVSQEDYQNHTLPAHLYPEIKHKLDYHKATALAYEKDNKDQRNKAEAEKFFKEFGLFGPMGNGLNFRRSSRTSLEEHIGQIRKNSNTLVPKLNNKKMSNVCVEDYEHLKVVVARLKKDFTELEMKYTAAQIELHEMKNLLSGKENEVLKLQREVHKLKVSAKVWHELYHLIKLGFPYNGVLDKGRKRHFPPSRAFNNKLALKPAELAGN